MNQLVFNERSWAIELISAINDSANRPAHSRIKRATGELGLRGGHRTLFPDVILMGDAGVLMGWELKLPDTNIQDAELLRNAANKADLLSNNSFLVWNGQDAALWKRIEDSPNFEEVKSWHRNGLSTRADVEQNPSIWVSMLREIILDLEHFLANGDIVRRDIIDVLDESFVLRIVNAVIESDAEKIEDLYLANEEIRHQVDEWASDNKIENAKKFTELAKLNAVSWINRLVFSHYLIRFNPFASKIRSITSSSTVEDAILVFDEITRKLDFANVFLRSGTDTAISETGWEVRTQLNEFLSELNLDQLPQENLQNVLEGFASTSKKRGVGQFVTPVQLASAMAHVAINDLRGHVADPCCGSGTIAKALYQEKRSNGISPSAALSTVWASDKYQLPLQLTSIALSDAQAMKSVVQVFKSNVFDLKQGQPLHFVDPSNPQQVAVRSLPKMSSIASNLPFVRQEILGSYGFDSVFAKLGQLGFMNAEKVYGKADLYSLILLKLHDLVADDGRVVVCVSNAWMGTDWGQTFQSHLRSLFNVVAVIQSGNGRWFDNAKVVTTVFVLHKTAFKVKETNYVLTERSISEWDSIYINDLKKVSIQGINQQGISFKKVSYSDSDYRESLGFTSNSNFFELDWLKELESKSIPISNLFEVSRGARTGWDPFFYPTEDDQKTIEDDYLVPVLKSSQDCETLVMKPGSKAFSCGLSELELRAKGHSGALAWISKFRNQTNKVGKPITQVLLGKPWYYLDPKETAHLAISMNPFKSISVFFSNNPIFVNQRMIRFSPKVSHDLELSHALMNSLFGMLVIEGSGFGRGEGVLDLRADYISSKSRMLNPALLSFQKAEEIKQKFEPVKLRKQLPFTEEISQRDRLIFEKCVLDAFGLGHLLPKLKSTLERMIESRLDV
jgi:hypothetical protein